MKKVAILFGGLSTEHEVSICSGTSVIENIDKTKYEILPIYIDKEGNYFKYTKKVNDIRKISVGEYPIELEKIDNILNLLKEEDVIFPILHGLYGEDGSFQGMFEILQKKYVGCKILASSICMDKVYTKIIFDKAQIKQAKYLYIKHINNKYYYVDNNFNENEVNFEDIDEEIVKKLNYPVFIKPSNFGSSIGINKSHNKEEMIKHLEIAASFDKKVLIEEAIVGKEVECAVLGKDENIMASSVGEVKAAEEFYSFDAKYKNSSSMTLIPAQIENNITKNIQRTAIKAFKAVDGCGISRVDFFVTNDNEIYINEINTMPGFTNISMYPKLFEYDGISYSELINRLIELS